MKSNFSSFIKLVAFMTNNANVSTHLRILNHSYDVTCLYNKTQLYILCNFFKMMKYITSQSYLFGENDDILESI